MRVIDLKQTEAIVDLIDGGQKEILQKVEYIDQNGENKILEDILDFTFQRKGENSDYGLITFLPSAGQFSMSVLNKNQKYSPETGSDLKTLMQRGRAVIPYYGYRIPIYKTDQIKEKWIGVTPPQGWTLAAGNNIDIINSGSSPVIIGRGTGGFYGQGENYFNADLREGLTDFWAVLYFENDGANLYDLQFNNNTGGSDFYLWIWESNYDIDTESKSENFNPKIIKAENGFNNIKFDSYKKYIQVCFVSYASSGNFRNIRIRKFNNTIWFKLGKFELDDPSFKIDPENTTLSTSGRDILKKAIDTDISLPAGTYNAGELIRKCFFRAGIETDDVLIPDMNININLDNNNLSYKADAAFQIIEEALLLYNSEADQKLYHIKINDNGKAEIVERKSEYTKADLQFDYRLNINSLTKEYNYSQFLQQVLLIGADSLTGTNINFSAENEIDTKNISNNQTINFNFFDYTLPDITQYKFELINKRFEIIINANPYNLSLEKISELIEITSEEKTSLSLKRNDSYSGLDIDIKLSGTWIENGSTEYYTEKTFFKNSIMKWGQSKKISSIVFQDQNSINNLADKIINIIGNKNYQYSANVRYNPFIEIGDKLMVYERETNTFSILVVTEYGLSQPGRMSIKMIDTGFDFTNFNFDRNNILNGDHDKGADDWQFDTGLNLDQDISFLNTDDPADYEYLRRYKIG